MNNHARILYQNGESKDLAVRPTLKEAQAVVDGYVQFLKAKEDKTDRAVTLVVNEEGRLQDLPTNMQATNNYSFGFFGTTKHFPLVGNVIVLYGWKTLA